MGIPLACIDEDSSVVLKAINAEKALSKKLRDMGLQPEKILSVVNKQSDGGVVLGSEGFKVAIDAMLARKILVLPA